MRTDRIRPYILILLIPLLLGGCFSPAASGDQPERKQLYFDANLQFEISYPEAWGRARQPVTLRPYSRQSAVWRIERQDDREVALELRVVSLAASGNPDGYAGLEALLQTLDGPLRVTANQPVTLPAGPARRLDAEASAATVTAWLFLGPQRHYLIRCSAAKPVFSDYRTLFEEIAASFRPVE